MDGDVQALAMRGLCRTGMQHVHRARHRWRPPARTAARALLPARATTPSAVAAIRGAQTPPARRPRAAHHRSRGERRFPSLRSRRPARGAPHAGARPPRAAAVPPVRARARRSTAAGAPPDVPGPWFQQDGCAPGAGDCRCYLSAHRILYCSAGGCWWLPRLSGCPRFTVQCPRLLACITW